jgi:murein DD-endopeptidase MepM/ murein hydrolase activator NlpD
MVIPSRRSRALVAGALAAAASVLVAPTLQAQVPPLVGSTTTTTAPSGSGSDADPAAPSSPSGSDFSEGSSPAPEGAKDAGGDGMAAPAGGIVVPPEAQRIISSVRRSGPSSNTPLLARLEALRELGLSEEETLRVGLGRFPIAGPARYSHDWLFPRYGPGFRFHLGTDVFAAHGTPVRAPVDGIAQSANGGLGGLTVKVVMADGTYFYLAHLSGLVEGFTQGMPVRTGDIVGFVGDSGNARGGAPHLHIGVYPHGGAPVDPKPILDQFLAEAEARVPLVVEAYRRAAPVPAAPPVAPAVSAVDEARALRPMLGTSLVHGITSRAAPWPVEVLYLASANALSGPRVLVEAAVDDIVTSIDWDRRAVAGG